MKTKLMRIAYVLFAAAIVSACNNNDDDLAITSGEGQIEFKYAIDGELENVETRATSGYKLPDNLIPSAATLSEKLTLKITGEYDNPATKEKGDLVQYNNSWTTLKEYNEADVKLNQGVYSAELANKPTLDDDGNIAEGENNPYFKGGVYGNTLTVTAGLTTDAYVSLALENCCFTLKVTEWFVKYYSDVELTISSENISWTYNPTSAEFTSPLIFVNADQRLKLSGKATKQNGVEVEFSETEISGLLKKEHHYNIVVDHSTAGGAGLTVTFGDNYTTVNEIEVDLRE